MSERMAYTKTDSPEITPEMLEAAVAVIDESGMLPWGELADSHSITIEAAIRAALMAQELSSRSGRDRDPVPSFGRPAHPT